MEQRHLLSSRASGGLSRDTISERLARGWPPRGRDAATANGDLLPGGPILTRPLRPAAVLVPLVERPEGVTVLLTQRTAHLAHHPGQISFPGGRLEDRDQGDSVACALRETEEEVGLSPGEVTVLGRLGDYATGTGFIVTPIVGATSAPLALTLDPFEVADVFEVPLDFVLDTANHSLHRREVDGRSRPYWAIAWGERLIWGATAGILVNLSEVLGRDGQ
ncbi:MAG: CoA pyrophosphatase [Magnetospirillum sp.]|nr:CoA pyrophosphatase [Magnetospirillum sp.]